MVPRNVRSWEFAGAQLCGLLRISIHDGVRFRVGVMGNYERAARIGACGSVLVCICAANALFDVRAQRGRPEADTSRRLVQNAPQPEEGCPVWLRWVLQSLLQRKVPSGVRREAAGTDKRVSPLRF